MAEEENDLLNGLVAGYLDQVSPAPPKRKLAVGIYDVPKKKKVEKKESGTSSRHPQGNFLPFAVSLCYTLA